MIKIGNRKNGDWGVYCGRPSPLGNPYEMEDQSIKERNRVCNLYTLWLHDKIAEEDPSVLRMFQNLDEAHKYSGELTLLCWCAPLRCHCETIKRYLEDGSWEIEDDSENIYVQESPGTNTG